MENTNTTTEQSMEAAVLEQIRTDKISMHSKAYYYAKVGLAILLALVFFGVSMLVFYYIVFLLRASGRSLLVGFGSRGFLFYLEAFPWWILAVDVLLVIMLERLVRQFKFAYRSPALYVLAGLLAVSALAGYGLAHTRLGGDRPNGGQQSAGIFNDARRAPLPERGVCRCTITAIDGAQLSVVDTENGDLPLTVVLPADDAHVHSQGLQVGDKVFIAGDLRGGILYAFGLHRVAPDEPAFPQPI